MEQKTDTSKSNTHWSDQAVVRLGANLIAVGLVLLVVFLFWQKVIIGQAANPTQQPVATLPPTPTSAPVSQPKLAPFVASAPQEIEPVISRQTELRTIIPDRPRVDVITYTVQQGDNLFGIADEYGLKPETILWGNYEVLEDNPHLLRPGQVLNILPTDGTYYKWSVGDNLQAIAEFFKTTLSAILEYPGNHIDVFDQNTATPQLESGTMLIIPGGKRAIKDWGPPAITRSNPASAQYYGEGHCGSVYEGAFGTGTFTWPTTYHGISGYTYSSIHPAIDIGGAVGNAIYASDSGVIVYAGWSNYGYGYLIVVDHGNGWQTAYAHLSAVAVSCGQSVYQGGYIGALGSTGNSTGPHLHFEMVYGGVKVNPNDMLP